uniref:Uncharacterized protein n=1 Tax=Amphiprion percula TaxID=161767 RepID=A0A3P8SG51_AMPPE
SAPAASPVRCVAAPAAPLHEAEECVVPDGLADTAHFLCIGPAEDGGWRLVPTWDSLFFCSSAKHTVISWGLEMTEVEPVLDFASSGRSGRRNALPDILGSPAGVNPGDLPLKLAELSLKDGPGGAQSPMGEEPPGPPESSE